MNVFISTWALLVAGLVFALPMIHLRVKEHTDIADEALYVVSQLSLLLADFTCSARMDDNGQIRRPEEIDAKH